MGKALEKILNTIVVPMDDRLSGVKVEKFMTVPNKYDVVYYLKKGEEIPFGSKSYERIEKETNNMFKMLGATGKDSFVMRIR